jgi:hypothetical protein
MAPMNGWTMVRPRSNGRTIPLLVGLALVLAVTLILVMVLAATAEETGRAATLSPSAHGGIVTVPHGPLPAGGEDGPPPARRGSGEAANPGGPGGPGGRTGGGSDGDDPETASAGGTAEHQTTGSEDPASADPAPGHPEGGSGGGEPDEPGSGSGGTTVSVGDVGVTVDPEETSVSVSVGDAELTLDPGDLLP